jgi:hypothetical protein
LHRMMHVLSCHDVLFRRSCDQERVSAMSAAETMENDSA